MKKILFTTLTLLFTAGIFAQSPAKYWVAFTDKKGTPYSIDKPEAFLSPRAIELRKAHGIAIDERDLPVSPDYVRQVLALDTAACCFTTSKWLFCGFRGTHRCAEGHPAAALGTRLRLPGERWPTNLFLSVRYPEKQ